MKPNLEGLQDRIAADVPQLKRGRVWCYTCGRTERVHAGNCLRDGWPKCCGYTMSIDSPSERERLGRAYTRETRA